MIQRSLIRAALLATLALGAPGLLLAGRASARPAAAHKTYTNATYGYSINYPPDWTVDASRGVQFFSVAPDKNAVLTANATPGSGTVAEITKAQQSALKSLGTPLGKVTTTPKQIHGLVFVISEQVLKTKDGRSIDALILDSVRHKRIYDFNAEVLIGKPSTDKEIKQIQNSLNAILIK